MRAVPVSLIYQVQVGPGEHLKLPDELVESVGEGVWTVTVQPCPPAELRPLRDHSSFLEGYAPEDEGLYDELAAG